MIHEILLYFSENSGEYIGYLLTHLRLSLQALLLASVVGLPLGYLCYKMDFLKSTITSLIQGFRVIPSLAVLFLLIPLVGIGKIPALIALTLLALPPILINTVLGFSELSPALLEVSLGLGMNSSQLLWRIQLPLALQYNFGSLYWGRWFGQFDYYWLGFGTHGFIGDWWRQCCTAVTCNDA